MRAATWIVLGLLGLTLADTAQAQLLQRLKQGLGKVLENQPATQPDAEPGFTPRTDEAFAPGYLGLTADEPRAGDRGVRVLAVREGSPAEFVGLRDGDVIVSIDGVAMRSLDDMDRLLARVTAGQTLRIVAERGGEQRTLTPKLTTRTVVRKEPAPEIAFEDGLRLERATGRATLGLSVAPLTEEARLRYGLTPTRGAVVTNVAVGSSAAVAKIPVGAAIVAIDGRRVDTADELVEQMRLVRADQEVELTFYQGDQLGRKVIRAVAVGDGPPRANAPLVDESPAVAGDRPILRKLEKVLEGATGGQGLPGGFAPAAVPPRTQPEIVSENEALRREVDLLRKQVDRLEGRLSELELRVRP